MRSRLYMLIQDSEGNLQEGAQVRVLQPGTTNPITVPMYEADVGASTITNPFISETGVINIYTDDPIRVRIATQVEGSSEQFIEDIDIGGSDTGEASDHPGLGVDSVRVGSTSDASGNETVAVGVTSTAQGLGATAVGSESRATQVGSTALGRGAESLSDQSIAVGRESQTSATGAVAIGRQSNVSGNYSVAIGHQTDVDGSESSVLGHGATAGHDRSVAIGPNVSTLDDDQIVLGNSDHSVLMRGSAVIQSPNSNKFEIRVTDLGVMYSSWHVSSQAVNLMTSGDDEFSGGVGGWTGSGTTVSTTTDSDISPNTVLTMDDADAGNYVQSGIISITEGIDLVGQAWVRTTDAFSTTAQLEYLDGADASLGTSTPVDVPPAADQWLKVSSRGTTPTGTAGVRLRITSVDGTSSDDVYIETTALYEMQ